MGDISLADFWGAEKFFDEKQIGKGISAVLCNSQKGCDFISNVAESWHVDVDVDAILQCNQPFKHPPIKPSNYETLMSSIIDEGYNDLDKYISRVEMLLCCLKASFPESIKRTIKSLTSKFL